MQVIFWTGNSFKNQRDKIFYMIAFQVLQKFRERIMPNHFLVSQLILEIKI